MLWPPARKWVEALPVGNRQIGAMVFGGVASDRFLLNEVMFFTGSPHDKVNPPTGEAMRHIRQQLIDGKSVEAPALADRSFSSGPPNPQRRGDGPGHRLADQSVGAAGAGDHAHAVVSVLLGPRRTYPDMFDAHPPFRLDDNCGGGGDAGRVATGERMTLTLVEKRFCIVRG